MGRTLHRSRAAIRTSRTSRGEAARCVLLAALLACLAPVAAGAAPPNIDENLCKDDGVSEVPPFAEGRNANNCLMIDPGNGDPAYPFEYSFFHKQDGNGNGIYAAGSSDGTPKLYFDQRNNGRCRSGPSGRYCTTVIWDTVIDNYMGPALANNDIWTSSGTYHEYMLIKDSAFRNGWKCGGGSWSGPNGISCSGTSSAHSDGFDWGGSSKGIPVNGGCFVIQDSQLVNAHISLLRWASGSPWVGKPGCIVLQGLELNIKQSAGYATHWIDDCRARGGTDACDRNNFRLAYPADPLWLIDVWGRTRLNQMVGNPSRVIMVNTGCGENGCNGTIDYYHGWPHPLDGNDTGPSVCPNGLMPGNCGGSAFTGHCYCYTSIENALNDTFTSTSGLGDCPDCPHERPPFLQLSTTGWADAPTTATNPRPNPVNFLP